jgi:acyl dehydratase
MSMTLEQWHKAVDDWVARENKRAGLVYKPSVGMYPPRQEGLIVSEMGINNRVAAADLIRHYADAIGDTNPLWRSEEYAKTTRYGSIIAPPRFLDCIAPPSGMGFGFPNFGVPGMNPLNRGSKHEWFKVVHAGDEFTVEDRYLGVEEVTRKDRPMPRLFLFGGSRKYINQKDEVVAIAEGGAIVVGSGPNLQGSDPAFAGIKRHKYTKKELEEIDRAYDAEKRQGMEVRYWENVSEGDELPPLVKGPLTVMDSVAFFNAIGYTTAFRVTQLLLRENPSWGVVDPETNVTYPVAGIHVSDANARAQGVPYAAGFSAQLEGNVTHLITDWMGDDGFLKKLDCQIRRILILGDAIWLRGNVVKKYIEGDEHLVDLKIWVENQDHITIMPATATVRLLSRTKY